MELPLDSSQEIKLSNKPGRVEAIRKETDKVLMSFGFSGFMEALSSRGRFAFAEGQTFGSIRASSQSSGEVGGRAKTHSPN